MYLRNCFLQRKVNIFEFGKPKETIFPLRKIPRKYFENTLCD